MSEPKTEEVPMVNVQINGVWERFPKGTRMIEACRLAGVDVPHYCYHPKLSSPGNCRMCLVEMGMPPRLAPGEEPDLDDEGRPKNIQWMPRPAISCANTVAEGMGIRTDSELAETCRKGVMEFLLINHPLDCPICDQAGECSLQEFSVEHGNGESRFRESKVKKPKNVDIGPRIRLDDERCIMCSRCIRFCDEIADDPVLGFTDRGSHTVLAVHPGEELGNNYSLNTADICPVGALTSNDFRFQMRVWFLKETESICTKCGRGCNTVIGSRENKVFRQEPRRNNDVNSDWMCDQGRLDFHYVNSDRRLTDPLVLENDSHAISGWAEALRVAASGVEGVDGGKIAIVASARMTNEELYLVRELAGTLGAGLVATVPRFGEGDNYLRTEDLNPNTRGATLILGEGHAENLEKVKSGVASGEIKVLLVFGEDLLKAGFEDAQLQSLDFLLSAHILVNSTAELADVVLPISSFAEKRGSMINVTGRLQRLGAAIPSPGNAMDTWEVLRDLRQAISGENGIYTVEEVFSAMAGDIKEFAGLSLGKIGSTGVHLVDTDERVPLLEREGERKAKGIIVG